MDVTYINLFVKAVQDVLAETMRSPVNRCTLHIKEPGEQSHKAGQLSFVIGLSGSVAGVVVATFPDRVTALLASSFTGKTLDAGTPECHAAIADLAQKMVQTAKTALPDGGIEMTVPTLCPTIHVQYPPNLPIIVIPFDTASGRIRLEIALRKRKAVAA